MLPKHHQLSDTDGLPRLHEQKKTKFGRKTSGFSEKLCMEENLFIFQFFYSSSMVFSTDIINNIVMASLA